MNNIKIDILNECACCIQDKEYNTMEKDEVINFIKKAKKNCNSFKIKHTESNLLNIYEIKFDGYDIKITIPKKYNDINKEYIDYFNSISNNSKKLKKYVFNSILFSSLAVAGIGVVLHKNDINQFIKLCRIEHSDKYAIEQLEWELKIHSGHAEIDGRQVYPQYDHGCVLENNTSIPIKQRIEIYCDNYLTDNNIFLNEVNEKFELLYRNDINEANKIELEKIYIKINNK